MIRWTLFQAPAFTTPIYSYQFDRREQVDGAEFPVYPWAKVCPYCLTTWAWVEADDHAIHSVPCEKCNRITFYASVPGSLLDARCRQGFDYDLLEDLPYELLLREFHLHVKSIERSAAVQLHHHDPLWISSDPLVGGGEVA